MSATKTKPKTMTVDEAAAEAAQAQDHYDDLRDRLEDGDLTVKQSDLADAREKADYAALQVKGAQAAAKREEHDRLRREAEAWKPEAEQQLRNAMLTVAAREQDARVALASLVEAVRAANQTDQRARTDRETFLPPDVPFDGKGAALPEWYQTLKPQRYGGEVDVLKMLLALTNEAVSDIPAPTVEEQQRRIELRKEADHVLNVVRQGIAKAEKDAAAGDGA